MSETRVTFDQLTKLLGERARQLLARNLVLVSLPLETAHRDAPKLALALSAMYVDFDCQLLTRMEADGWEDHVALERRGTLAIGQHLAVCLARAGRHASQPRSAARDRQRELGRAL